MLYVVTAPVPAECEGVKAAVHESDGDTIVLINANVPAHEHVSVVAALLSGQGEPL